MDRNEPEGRGEKRAPVLPRRARGHDLKRLGKSLRKRLVDSVHREGRGARRDRSALAFGEDGGEDEESADVYHGADSVRDAEGEKGAEVGAAHLPRPAFERTQADSDGENDARDDVRNRR